MAIWEAAVGRKAENLDYYDIVVGLRMALVVVGAFDRQVSVGHVTADHTSLNANLMTMYLAEKMGMPLPDLGPAFYDFMSTLTPVEEKYELRRRSMVSLDFLRPITLYSVIMTANIYNQPSYKVLPHGRGILGT